MQTSQSTAARVAVWVLVWRITGAAQFAEYFAGHLLNFPPLKVTPELLFAAPVVFLLLHALWNNRLKFPHWKALLLFQGVALAIEFNAALNGSIFEWKYAYGLFLLYAAFIALVNSGEAESDWRTVRKAFLGAVVLITSITILSWVTPLDLDFVEEAGAIGVSEERFSARRLIHPNQMAFTLSIGILLILADARRTALRLTRREGILIAAALVVVVLNAARSGFLLAIIALVTHFLTRRRWIDDRSLRAAVVVVGIVLSLSVALILVSFLSDSVFLFSRFQEFTSGEARIRQIYVTWINFLNYPIFGRGHFLAAQGVVLGYTRSNFHFTQVLASYGIVGFTCWAVLLWQMFASHRRIDRILAVALCLAADNWAIIFAIAVLGYMNYFERSRELKQRRAARKPASPKPVIVG